MSEKVSPIRHIESIDLTAFYENWEFIKPDLLIDALYALHEQLADMVHEVMPALTKNQQEALSDCLQAVRKEFVSGCITALRAHTTDSENYRRKAIEFCAFGIEMIRNPHAATVWLDAILSKRKYENYKSHFSVMSLLKSCADTGIKLAVLYNELCKEVHASPYAIKTQTRILVDPLGRRVNWLVYHDDYNSKERYDLAQRFVTGLKNDFFILVVFAQALSMKFPELQISKWNEATNTFLTLVEEEKARIAALPSN